MATKMLSSEGRVMFDLDDPRVRITPSQQMLASCTGALITSLSMTPLDVVKTRIQAQQRALLSNKCFLYCNGLMDHLCPCGPNGTVLNQKTVTFTGTIDAFLKISRNEGVKSLWSGLSPTLVLAIPATVVYFVAYEQIRLFTKNEYMKWSAQAQQPFWIPLFAGCFARVFSVSIVSPLELIRTKMQSQKMSYHQMGIALKEMIATQGIFGLWKGLTSTLLRDVPFSGIYWTVYETTKKTFDVVTPSMHFSFGAGALSGSIAALITTPFDVVKTNRQIAFGEKVFSGNGNSSGMLVESTFATFRTLLKNGGLPGLFAGLIPRVAKVAPACAIMISSFEYGKSFFFDYNVQKLYVNY